MTRFENILCVVDKQSTEQHALERAVVLAEQSQARVTLVAVTEPIRGVPGMNQAGAAPAELHAGLIDAAAESLNALIEPYKARVDIKAKVLTGTPFLAVIREVLRNGHDLVLKCPESPEWLNRFFSSDDMHLLRKCPCPVWLARPRASESYRRILAAVDVDDSYPPEELETRHALNTLVMELAGSLAVSESAQLHVAHAWEAAGEGIMRHGAFMTRPEKEIDAYVERTRGHHAQLLDKLMTEFTTTLGQAAIDRIKPELHMPKGLARKEIPALATQLGVDCIVMGTVARTGISGFIMGNTAETILDQIGCSVLAIKPPGFKTPVTLEG